ncbi:MAG: hypothetical protein ACUVRD_00770 [Bacteroidia bacterium]
MNKRWAFVSVLTTLSGCCQGLIKSEGEVYSLPSPKACLSIGTLENAGKLGIVASPTGPWSYVQTIRVLYYAPETKAFSILGEDKELFTIMGDGTVHAFAPINAQSPIQATEYRVVGSDRKWPDYVFSPEYKLPSLSEVEAYIRSHRHLPGMPSAKEFQEKGISLVENQLRLLQKVEELTLYILQLQHQVDSLKSLPRCK